MNIKDLSVLRERIVAGEAEQGELRDMMATLYSCVGQSKEVILGKISEQDFVGVCRTVKSAVLSTALADGDGKSVLLAELAGELDGVLDTYFLAVLGLLMQEEVL